MHMVWHYDERIQLNRWKTPRGFVPCLGNHVSRIAWYYQFVDHIPEQQLPLMRTYRDEIRSWR